MLHPTNVLEQPRESIPQTLNALQLLNKKLTIQPQKIPLSIANFILFPEKPDYLSHHAILDKNSFWHDLKDFSFSFLELPKFKKHFDELFTMTEKWAYFFKHADETSEAEIPKLNC